MGIFLHAFVLFDHSIIILFSKKAYINKHLNELTEHTLLRKKAAFKGIEASISFFCQKIFVQHCWTEHKTRFELLTN